MGGWAPDYVIWKLGIHPRTGRAFICYINQREVSEEVADRELTKWRTWLRECEAARLRGIELPQPAYSHPYQGGNSGTSENHSQ